MLEIGCAWSKGSAERLQGHHDPLVIDKILVVFENGSFWVKD